MRWWKIAEREYIARSPLEVLVSSAILGNFWVKLLNHSLATTVTFITGMSKAILKRKKNPQSIALWDINMKRLKGSSSCLPWDHPWWWLHCGYLTLISFWFQDQLGLPSFWVPSNCSLPLAHLCAPVKAPLPLCFTTELPVFSPAVSEWDPEMKNA